MEKKRFIEMSLILLAVCGVLTGLYASLNDIFTYFHLAYNHRIREVILTLVVVSAGLGILGLIYALVLLKYVPNIMNEIFYHENRYDLRKAKRSEIPQLYELCVEGFGEDVASVRAMKNWYDKNPSLFWVIEKKDSSKLRNNNQIVGYFDILPITKNACTLLENEEVNGTNLTTEHITRTSQKPSGIYIGGIYAKGFQPKAATLAYLKSTLEDWRRQGVVNFYTRPTSSRGLALVQKHEFEPINDAHHEPSLEDKKKGRGVINPSTSVVPLH